MNRKKKLNIAIIGLGNIGAYLFKFLKMNKSILSKKQLRSKYLCLCKK